MDRFIVIHHDTFLWYDETQGIFYNCEKKTFFHFNMTPLLFKYCSSINDFNNMYAVGIEPEDEKDSNFSLWLNQIVDYNIGEIKTLLDGKRPFSFPPILNLQHEIEEKRMDNEYYRSINIANNLHELTFLLGGEILNDDETGYYKQIHYPISMNTYLEANSVCSILDKNNIGYLQQINIISNNFAAYPDLEFLLSKLSLYTISVTYYLKGDDVNVVDKILQYAFLEKTSLGLYFTNLESLQKIEKSLEGKGVNYEWIFLLRNEGEPEQIQDIVETYNLKHYKLLPVFTNDVSNLSFFKDYIFTTYDDLSQLSLTKRNIFCNQVINSNCWGKLFITPDMNVYSNLNGEPIGTAQEDLLYLIRKEMTSDFSYWKCTREKHKPCNDCIYRSLCPPPSNYEFFLKQFDMCTVR